MTREELDQEDIEIAEMFGITVEELNRPITAEQLERNKNLIIVSRRQELLSKYPRILHILGTEEEKKLYGDDTNE